jgi:hypothetical protein
MLDKLTDPEAGDIQVNVAGELPPFHPHVTGPFLRSQLEQLDQDTSGMKMFTVIRHPVEMLWSYYKFFKPDTSSRYNFDNGWEFSQPMGFERWICEGKIPADQRWLDLAPSWIDTQTLSVLSLEFYACQRDGRVMLDGIFQVEHLRRMQDWIEEETGIKVELIHTNMSNSNPIPEIGDICTEKVRYVFPLESAIYNI